MSNKKEESTGTTDTLLIIAAVIAVVAGGAVYYFHGNWEEAQKTLEQAKKDYLDIVAKAPKIHQLVLAKKDLRKGGNTSDPVTFLGSAFRRAGFSNAPVVSQERGMTGGGWKETPYKVHFRRQRDTTINRVLFINTMVSIERQRPDLRTKNIAFTFKDGNLIAATVTFSKFERQ